MEEGKQYIGFFNGDDIAPKYLEIPEEGIPKQNMLYETAVVRAAFGRPIWGTRTK